MHPCTGWVFSVDWFAASFPQHHSELQLQHSRCSYRAQGEYWAIWNCSYHSYWTISLIAVWVHVSVRKQQRPGGNQKKNKSKIHIFHHFWWSMQEGKLKLLHLIRMYLFGLVMKKRSVAKINKVRLHFFIFSWEPNKVASEVSAEKLFLLPSGCLKPKDRCQSEGMPDRRKYL